jgi:hypothetical protein
MPLLSTIRVLAEVAAPILSASPPKKHVDKAVDRAAGEKPAEAETATIGVAEVASAATLLRLVAEPPLILERGGWRCAESTRVVVTFGGGQERAFEYSAGTLIPLAQGMIHFPEETALRLVKK